LPAPSGSSPQGSDVGCEHEHPPGSPAHCSRTHGGVREENDIKRSPIVLIGIALLIAASIASAEADGPDFWAVQDVKEDDVLNIREKADPHSKKIGEIPPDGTCIENLGCVGGLTFEEFTTLSDEEKEIIKLERPR